MQVLPANAPEEGMNLDICGIVGVNVIARNISVLLAHRVQ